MEDQRSIACFLRMFNSDLELISLMRNCSSTMLTQSAICVILSIFNILCPVMR